ncbi:MAG: hypothetical protein AB7P21_09990 [Lautropia sp.]
MQALIDSGRILDLLLALVAIEAIVLATVGARVARPLRAAAILPNLAAGAALLGAARSVSLAADWRLTAGLLALAGLAHLLDLLQRMREPARPASRPDERNPNEPIRC